MKGWFVLLSCLFATQGLVRADAAARDAPPDQPRPCSMALTCQDPIDDHTKITCHLIIAAHGDSPVFDGKAGIEYRGRGSAYYPKRNYALELRDGSGDDLDMALLGMASESDYVLDGSWMDTTFVRNAFAYELFRGLGDDAWAPRSRFCQLSINGDNRGLYRLSERPTRSPGRIAIGRDRGAGDTFLVKQDDDGEISFKNGARETLRMLYPKGRRATEEQIAGVQAFFDELAAALRSAKNGSRPERVFELLDFDNVVDWVLLQELMKNVDAYDSSLYVYRNADGLARFTPWDFDLTMGLPTITCKRQEAPEGWTREPRGTGVLIDGLRASPRFRKGLAKRWRSLRKGPWSDTRIMALLERLLKRVDQHTVRGNFARWPIEDVKLESVHWATHAMRSHAEEAQRQEVWLKARLTWIDSHIEDFPTGRTLVAKVRESALGLPYCKRVSDISLGATLSLLGGGLLGWTGLMWLGLRRYRRPAARKLPRRMPASAGRPSG